MPISVTFVLGRKESYFFNSPTHWAWHNLPPDIEALFTKTPPIRDVIELALGEQGTYFVSYRDHDNQVLAKHYNLPDALTSYLYHSHPAIIRDLATLSITLGPFQSFYAWDKTSASWSNLPPKLEKSVMNRVESQDAWKTTWKANGAEAPSFVSLGADEAYWMRTVSGGGCWDLKCNNTADGMAGMRGTNKFLEESKDFSGIAGLHLFPTHSDAYILITTTGKAFSNLPEFTWADYNKLAPALPAFVQTAQPIPPMPQPRQQPPPQPQPQPQPQVLPMVQPQAQYQQVNQPQLQFQQVNQQPQPQHNCCPPNTLGAPHNCCAQTPMQPRPFGIPVPVAYANAPVVGQLTGYGQTGYGNGGYAAGPVYR